MDNCQATSPRSGFVQPYAQPDLRKKARSRVNSTLGALRSLHLTGLTCNYIVATINA